MYGPNPTGKRLGVWGKKWMGATASDSRVLQTRNRRKPMIFVGMIPFGVTVESMSDDIVVNKSKFDSLLQKMLSSPPLPKSEVRVAKPKPKKRKRSSRSLKAVL
jgi:hypothetical protein